MATVASLCGGYLMAPIIDHLTLAIKPDAVITMSPFEKRYPGRVAELLFNVWLLYQLESGALTEEQIKELPVMSTEKVNWLKKGTAFLKAKFLGKKYDKSF